MKKYIFILFIISMCVTPVAANVTYPQEYYTLSDNSNIWYNSIIPNNSFYNGNNFVASATIGTFIELRRQTILMEKQNELQAELVKAQWVETCYRQMDRGIGNFSAWNSECVNAGYPMS